jgi:hypothetical protein
MVRYIPTHDGQRIVSLLGNGTDMTCCDSLSIPAAELMLRTWRKDAWDAGLRGSPLADLYLEWSNSVSDALDYAAALRSASGQRAA